MPGLSVSCQTRPPPSEYLLRSHNRHAVLANVKDAGELLLGHDFPPGSDMISQILRQPKAIGIQALQ